MFGNFLKYWPRNDSQSCTVTMIRPSWVPTSCTLFKPLLLEVSTNLANSYNEETWVTLYTFLIKPKDWSGPNFVCPAIRKEYVIERWSFSKILYVRYQRKNRFCFGRCNCPHKDAHDVLPVHGYSIIAWYMYLLCKVKWVMYWCI